ncbi:adenosine kinase [Cylindrobasidium torrendii FP15055 ss-10]|uniref:Adenosine kinase n=1 Tax=Cylindrobasidium torrendii FP15055 ss-10 TaxID=1314674 RepID=A0A0D7BHD7_9AGAR|nr:adenosine kinase [Cylindrobasidium torrendii FP15055 ss-10]
MSSTPALFCIGNPLLDIIATDEKLLTKYGLEANGAILAEEKQNPIYEDLVKNHKVTYVAGGAAQNAARGAAYILPPGSVAYTGCVGDDDLAEQLKAANKKEGLIDVYQVKKGEQTGACAVVVTGHHRSLCTTLRGSEKFDESHLESATVKPVIDGAKVFYLEGYFLTHGAEILARLAQKVSVAGKVSVINFSAPFIPQFFNPAIQAVLPYIDIVICNETEAEAWANSNGVPNPTDLPSVAKAIASYQKSNPSRPRTAIITHGAEPTIVVSSDAPDSVKEYPVHKLAENEIVDTNAAGDGFAGGFLGAFVLDKSLDECIAVGQKMATMVIQQVGAQYQWPKVNLL